MRTLEPVGGKERRLFPLLRGKGGEVCNGCRVCQVSGSTAHV